MPTWLALLDDGDALDLDAGIERQPRRLDRRARRRRRGEPLAVGLVDRGEVAEVGDEDRGLDDVAEPGAGGGEHGADVVERAPGQRADVTLDHLAGRRIDRDLPRAEDHAGAGEGHDHRLRVRTDRGGRLRGLDRRPGHPPWISRWLVVGAAGIEPATWTV